MATKPIAFKIGSMSGNMYYNSKELNIYDPEFYYGCKTKPRNIIQKKKIPESEIIYANLKQGQWNLSSDDCKKAQLLISKLWVDKHYFKESSNERNVETELVIEEKEKEKEKEKENEVIETAPLLLHLNDGEKFRDTDGKIIDIETRGERHEDNIYFKVKDISNGFEMKNLNDILNDKDGGYEKNKDYKYFFNRVSASITCHDTIKKCLYLTYEGLLRVLFVSRNKNASIFRKWATNKLFTIQMGSKEEKIKLGTDILNISTKTYKAVFDSYADKFPCIYLISLGKVGLLRETFGIDSSINDDYTVYKYGFSDDLSRRLGEHDAKYGKLKNVTVKLSTFHVIDVKYTSEAEADIRDLCKVFEKNLAVEGYNELIVLNDKEFVKIKKYYTHIGKEYAGATLELTNQNTELKNRIKDLENEITNMKSNGEITSLKYMLEIQDKDAQLKYKDLEIKYKDLQLSGTI